MVIFCEVRKNHHELYILMTFRTFVCFLTYLTDVKILPTDMFSFLKHYKDSIHLITKYRSTSIPSFRESESKLCQKNNRKSTEPCDIHTKEKKSVRIDEYKNHVKNHQARILPLRLHFVYLA